MNRLLTSLTVAATATAAMLFAACDNIDENDRFIEMPFPEAQRTVLIEDFTGQNCKNCPNAHDAIHALQEQYGDALIAVSIHPAGNGLVYDEATYGPAGLGTEDGRIIATMAQAGNQLPIGQVDRTTGLIDYPSWATAVYDAVKRPTIVNIEANAAISDSIITVMIDFMAHDDFDGKLNIWVLEDSVVARQLLPNGSRDNNYVHNHLLRKAITQAEGTPFTLKKAVESDVTLEQKVQPHWNINHLRVVAFLTDTDGAVEQAINIVPQAL